MKTERVKTLATLLFGLGGLGLSITPAFADYSKESDESKNSSVSANTAECKGQLVNACGVKVVKTTCTGHGISASTKDTEHDDSSHDPFTKDSNAKNDRDYNDDSHKDHHDHSADATGNKVSICHRMGGAEVSLTVANDGWMSGHSKHPLDTIGRCSDFDTAKNSDDGKAEQDKDHKISISDAGYKMGLTTTQIACLKGSPDSTYTINGKTYNGAGLNSSNFTFTLQSSSQGPSRGGARTLH